MNKRQTCTKTGQSRRLGAPGGFTLVEVLVVMAIMVILFGMLFVPISSSIDMTREGQSRVQAQQRLQLAMELIARELGEAEVIFLPEYIPLVGADLNPNTPDDQYLINYSNITFQTPSMVTTFNVVRYGVMTRLYDLEPIAGNYYCVPQPVDVGNPWILYRMEGEMRRIPPVTGRNYFGSETNIDTDGDGNPDIFDQFVIGLPAARTALTPRRTADVPVTRTICLDSVGYLLLLVEPYEDGEDRWARGYVDRNDLDGNGTDDIVDVFGGNGVALIYLHDGMQFGPLRVENERLFDAGSGDTATFTADYSHWLGLQNPTSLGTTYSIGQAIWGPIGPMLIYSSELRPRIVVRREAADVSVPPDGILDYVVIMDTDDMPGTYDPNPDYHSGPGTAVINNMYGTSWDSEAGSVTVDSPGAVAADFDPTSPPTDQDETWDFTTSGYGTITSLGNAVYGEDIQDTTLATAASSLDTSIDVNDASVFNVGDSIRIVDADNIINNDDVTIASIDIVADPDEITFAPALGNDYEAGDLVRQTVIGLTYRRAYSSYQVTPPIEPGLDPDKMIISDPVHPNLVQVQVIALRGAQQVTCDYARVTFTDQDAIGSGDFAIEASGASGQPDDYTRMTIHFANGVNGRPPNPDNPVTYGGDAGWLATELSEFRIVVSYAVRRNFSTATLANDQIDVSYSTRAVYNINLELLPWRPYEDEGAVWQPVPRMKGVHLQGHILIPNIGG